MSWAVCYYSGSGNTRLACEFVASRLTCDVDLIDITVSPEADLSAYEVVGLATFTDFGGIPMLFERYLGSLPDRSGKPAFCLNTYGLASARTSHDLAAAAAAAGFGVFAAHSFRMPESYPPMIAMGLGFAGQPSSRRVRALEAFVKGLPEALDDRPSVGVPLASRLMPPRPRTTARDDMGTKTVDETLCTRCGTCARGCPYSAIELSPCPAFDQGRCFGCWRCYNRCPNHAISTARFHGPYYPHPSEHARAILSSG